MVRSHYAWYQHIYGRDLTSIRLCEDVKIDVAFCTYNSAKYLDACLNGIEQVFDVNNLIVVDHYSTDGTIEIAKRHGANIYFENQGFAYALNLAIQKARTDIFAIIDSDVVLTKGQWVSQLFRSLKIPKSAALVFAYSVMNRYGEKNTAPTTST